MRFWIMAAAILVAHTINPKWTDHVSLNAFLGLGFILALGLFADVTEWIMNTRDERR